MKILSDTGFLSVRFSLLVFTMAVQFSNATSPFLSKQYIKSKCGDEEEIRKLVSNSFKMFYSQKN